MVFHAIAKALNEENSVERENMYTTYHIEMNVCRSSGTVNALILNNFHGER